MFKVESFTNNVYDGELEQSYNSLKEARNAMKADKEIYNLKECLYLISCEGRMVELWEVRHRELYLKKEY